jgi:signal transduction histidine kinase
MGVAMGDGSGRGLARFGLPAAVATAILLTCLLAAFAVLLFTLPASVPSTDAHPGDLVLSISFVSMGAIAILLLIRRPGNRIGWMLGAGALLLTSAQLGPDYGYHWLYARDVPEQLVVPVLAESAVGYGAVSLLLILLPLMFPTGRLLSRRWRAVVGLALLVALAGMVASIADPNALGDGHRSIPNPLGIPGAHDVLSTVSGLTNLMIYVLGAVGLVSLGIRYRRAARGSQLREQVKWFFAGIVILLVGLISAGFLSPDTSSASWSIAGDIAGTIGFSGPPVAIGIAVLRYRLYDIDVVFSRALVYGALAAFITLVYVAIVVGIGTLIGSGGQPNLLLSILATAIVAVGFQPARERLQRVANRLVYGNRATPYEVLSQFSGQVAESYAAAEVLPRMARVLAEGTGAEHATVWLRASKQLRPAATYPDSVVGYEPLGINGGSLPEFPDAPRAVPVRHRDELLGALTVTKRRGESLTPMEENLLEDLGRQAGLVLKNVGLTADLQARLEDLRASRQRLVAAQDQERRRLERNLHDGAQQYLVAIKVKLGLAEALLSHDPGKGRTALAELGGDADEALETLRDLARGIYPPLLADKGLPAALESQARKATLPVVVEAEGIDRFPQDVEAAVYFSVLEALQNVQKYAGASSVRVRLWAKNEELRFEVSDDGAGFDAAHAVKGSGLTNILDRLDALGGGMSLTSEAGHGTTLGGWLRIDLVPARP